MAITFLEPGGDADFSVATTNGFWGALGSSQSVATDFVHGNHKRSIKYGIGGYGGNVVTPGGVVSDSGGRISFYVYINTLGTSNGFLLFAENAAGGVCFKICVTSTGILRMLSSASTQIGTDGPILSIGTWYRISLAYTITNTTTNRFELFLNGTSAISITNATLTTVVTNKISFGAQGGTGLFDLRTSDHYIDNSSSLADTGNIWVTAKRPFANGTTNGFTTQIGSGGSGYGTGHSPQVNERPLSTTNGWSVVGAGSAVTEEYNIESKSTGDIDISGSTIIDYTGWASMSSLAGETVQMIVNGVNFAQAITSTITLYTKVTGSIIYPAGTGTDIGVTTDTSLTTVSLYECGVMVAYIPAPPPSVGSMLTMFQ